MSNEKNKLPKTIDEAAELVISLMADEDKNTIRDAHYLGLPQVHHSYGRFIRNQCGLWKGNEEFLKLYGGEGLPPDIASEVILYKVWKKLNNYSDKDLEEVVESETVAWEKLVEKYKKPTE